MSKQGNDYPRFVELGNGNYGEIFGRRFPGSINKVFVSVYLFSDNVFVISVPTDNGGVRGYR